MKRAILVVAMLAAAAAVIPSAASAATIKHRGHIVGDRSTPVTFTLIKRQGRPVAVRNFALRRITMNCDEGGVSFRVLRSLAPIRVRRGGAFRARLPQRGGDGAMRIRGKILRSGRNARGQVRATYTSPSTGTCRFPRQGYRTRRV